MLSSYSINNRKRQLFSSHFSSLFTPKRLSKPLFEFEQVCLNFRGSASSPQKPIAAINTGEREYEDIRKDEAPRFPSAASLLGRNLQLMSYLPVPFVVILPITPIHSLLAILIGLVSRIVCDVVKPLVICRYAIEQTRSGQMH